MQNIECRYLIEQNTMLFCLTCINCFTAGESNNPFKNTRSVSLAPALLSNSDTFSRTCWNAAGNKD